MDEARRHLRGEALIARIREFVDRWRGHFRGNKPVSLALMTQAVNFFNGIVLVFLIASCLSPEAQGFYYTFGGLVSIQLILDFDFQVVLLFAASHEWSRLKLNAAGAIEGDPGAFSRLVGLGRTAFAGYCAAGILSALVIGAVGIALMSRQFYPSISWESPWIVLVIFSGLLLWARSLVVLVEGCNQVLGANRLRLYEALARAATMWTALLLGRGLWAPAAAGVAASIVVLLFLFSSYTDFFKPFLTPPASSTIRWKEEIWPVQWRIGLSGIGSYFAAYSFGPIMFYCSGAVVAGQTGMTLALIVALQNAASALIIPKRPLFGVLIAKCDFAALDDTWLRFSFVSVIMLTVGAFASGAFVYILNRMGIPLAGRFLPPLTTGILLAWGVLRHVSFCLNVYLRAHKKDPTMLINIVSSFGSALAILLLGGRYGPEGASFGLLAVAVASLAGEFKVWRMFRRQWH